jgi:phosphoribosylformylglycinamidine cyclo-ligase
MAKATTYKKAGVDIDKANYFVKKIRPLVENTYTKNTLGTIGHFGGFFKADFAGMKDPILVSSTDGVGTKLLVANIVKKFDTVGIDLVAMCVNDIVACGARPLFFLDYFATGKIKPTVAVDIVKGIVRGCKEAECALIGGETAEMPGLYRQEDFDLSGFCVGVVDKKNIIDGSKVKAGDRILGLASSGIHSNGYSLVRKIFSESEMRGKYKTDVLKPTFIYVKPILALAKGFKVKAIAHITGGGFYDNIPRILADGTAAAIDKGSWLVPSVFEIIRKRSKLDDAELYRTFNMGIGMAVILDKNEIQAAIEKLKKYGMKAWNIGEVVKWAKKEVIL